MLGRQLLVLVLLANPAVAQEMQKNWYTLDGLNAALENGKSVAAPTISLITKDIPDWGILVKDREGKIIETFGQIDYSVSADGTILVPGYDQPEGTSVELASQQVWLEAAAKTEVAPILDRRFAPIEAIPTAVGTATEYLANKLCGMKGRPTEISLSLVVGASGGIFFAEVNTEAGSQVTWNFPDDVCPRFEAAKQ